VVRSSSVRLLVLVSAVCLLSGCWTGWVYERGRIRESVRSYERAALEGERVLVEYDADLVDANGRLLETERRAAAIERRALGAAPEIPVDSFPVEAIDPGAELGTGGRPLRLVPEGASAAIGEAPVLEVITEDGRDRGFYLATGDGKREGFFRSEALFRNHTAWWVYALVPFSAALDAALFPVQVVSVAPFFLAGD